MYKVKFTGQFKRDYKLCKKRGLDMSLLDKAISVLATEGELPSSYRPHKLVGKYSGCWECHIQPDWLLVYKIDQEDVLLLLFRTGTHSDLF